MKFIAQISLAAVLLLVVYSVLITRVVRLQKPAVQHQWDENTYKAEQLRYSSLTYERIIVGSSLAARLSTEKLPKTYNLCFQGGAAIDGLRIIAELRHLPHTVLIETNVLLRGPDEKFINAVTNPLQFHVKEWLPGLKVGNRPLAIVGQKLKPYIQRVLELVKTNEKDSEPETAKAEVFNTMLKSTIQSNRDLPIESESESRFQELKEIIDYLTSKGVCIVFFEMPMHCEITNSPRANFTRDRCNEYFGRTKYKYLPDEPCQQYHTTDGIHLDKEEALQYSTRMANDMARQNL